MTYAAAFGPERTASLLEVRGRLLELRRVEAGLDPSTGAASAGLDPATLCAIEAGRFLPSEVQLGRLAVAWRATTEELERELLRVTGGLLADGVHLFIPGGVLTASPVSTPAEDHGQRLPPGSEPTLLAGAELRSTIASLRDDPSGQDRQVDLARRCVERLRLCVASSEDQEPPPLPAGAVDIWPEHQDIVDETLELASALMNSGPGQRRTIAVSLARSDVPRAAIQRAAIDGRPVRSPGDVVAFGASRASTEGTDHALDLLAGALATLVEGSGR